MHNKRRILLGNINRIVVYKWWFCLIQHRQTSGLALCILRSPNEGNEYDLLWGDWADDFCWTPPFQARLFLAVNIAWWIHCFDIFTVSVHVNHWSCYKVVFCWRRIKGLYTLFLKSYLWRNYHIKANSFKLLV